MSGRPDSDSGPGSRRSGARLLAGTALGVALSEARLDDGRVDVTPPRKAFVHEATLLLLPPMDSAAIGPAVTVALCDSVDHEGPRRWPSTNAIAVADDIAVLRIVFVATESEEREVRLRLRAKLRSSDEWIVKSDRTESLTPSERALAGTRSRGSRSTPVPGAVRRRPVSVRPADSDRLGV